MLSSGRPTFVHNHLHRVLHTGTSSIHSDLTQVRVEPNQTEWLALDQVRQSSAHSKNADIRTSTMTLQLQPPQICPMMYIAILPVRLEAAQI